MSYFNEPTQKDFLEAHIESLKARITELEEKLRWIPVSERLPEAGLEVECAYDVQLAYSVHRIVFIGSFNMYGDWEFISADGSICKSCIPIMFWREISEL